MTRRVAWWLLLWLSAVARLHAATEYIYGIGTDWKIYEIDVDKTANTVSTSAKLNLSTYVTGWGTHNNEYINGLAIDSATGNIYFNYSYNNSIIPTSGTMSVVPYIYQNVNGSYVAPYALGAVVTSATLPATSVATGYLPRSAYYNGAYWLGVQNSDTLVQFPITGTTTKSYSVVNQFSNFDHSSTTVLGGGDFVIGTNDVIYGSTVISSGNTFFRQQLSNATNVSSGAAWTNFNVESSLPFATEGSIQVAGLGQSTNLYVITSTGKNVYYVNNPDSSTAPTFTQVGSSAVIPVVMTDLSIIVSSPLPVPEVLPFAVVPSLAAAGLIEGVRRLRRRGPADYSGWFRRGDCGRWRSPVGRRRLRGAGPRSRSRRLRLFGPRSRGCGLWQDPFQIAPGM